MGEWKEQREEIARRNADAQKRAQATKKQRERAVASSAREDNDREAEQLRNLNAMIAKRRSGVSSVDRV